MIWIVAIPELAGVTFHGLRGTRVVELRQRGARHMDDQYSIPAPWSEEAGKETRVMVDSFGNAAEYLITVRGKDVRFEWGDRFGPLPINRDGSEARSIGPKHGFWRAASLWNLQGRRLDGNRAVWHEPKKPVLKHLGGRNYLVIEDGEEGYDW